MTSGAVAIRFGPEMRAWQKECAQHTERFQVLALHRRAGKTEIALKRLLDAAVKNKKELPQFFYVAPFLKQAKSIAWTRLKQLVAPLIPFGTVEVLENETSVKFMHNGAVVRLYGGDNPDGMRGNRLDGVVIDEVAQIKPEVWDDILQPALSDRLGWAMFIGTPDGVNLFSELFYKAKETPDWHSALYSVYDTDALLPQEVERLRRDMREESFKREYLCDFAAAGDNQLISLTDVETACRRDYKPMDVEYEPKIIGVDPARFGDDRSVIFKRQGRQAMEPIVMRGVDNMTLASRVASVIDTWEPDAVFIDAGNGGGVIDRLRQLDHDVIEVNFGGKANDAHYANKRAEMWFGMRDWITSGGALPNISDLKQDLGGPTYGYDKTNRLLLESKDDLKKRGLPSPDLADALALTFAHPVGKRRIELPGASGRAAKEYDPYATAA